MKQLGFIPAAALLALAACQPPSDPNAADPGELNVDAANIEAVPPSETPGPGANGNAAANQDLPAPLTVIPAAFHGQWGMVPADCTSTRGDNKGLITVEADGIRFYESRATLTKVTQNAPENFTGDFKFTGEGQTWTKPQNLKLAGSSNSLIRSESDPAMSFTYKRCTA
jgi:hypothetical protein